ncbi:hypothetical protein KL86PLE_100249 [uncultured Pleomorphomonas sp.]|uniref:Uncharacterized protein n=1 Tax=uncultured Pleomorphomonas sp. TaxID=442121 RepID=A0A212L1V0_9HYPH|nr:hypothetical protein [uncultured Pleomorphomonas sp.]SCM71525.1 hypothetical protein KL86PLE_100249 [uncultured Pleomorphomonas sp.]
MSQADKHSTTSAHTVETLMAQANEFAERIDMLDAGATAMFEGLVMALRGAENAAIERRARSVAGCVYQLRVMTRLGEDLLQLIPEGTAEWRKADSIVGQMHRAIAAVVGRIEELPEVA